MTVAPATPDSRLDAVILASATGEFVKVAMLIFRAVDEAKLQALDTTAQAIANRIYALVADQKLEAHGNVRRWRASEVRLKPSP